MDFQEWWAEMQQGKRRAGAEGVRCCGSGGFNAGNWREQMYWCEGVIRRGRGQGFEGWWCCLSELRRCEERDD